jgi:asparagine synthase (glutamine-hydrolysing)
MCGIWAYISSTPINAQDYEHYVQRLTERGPEGTRVQQITPNIILGFTRLAINGLTPNGMQPMYHNGLYAVTNGEIYNYKELAKEFSLEMTTGSDCEIVPKLYERLGDLTWTSLDGVFATIVIDPILHRAIIARDPYGIRPLFYGECGSGLIISSEIKGLIGLASNIRPLEPGTFLKVDTLDLSREQQRWHQIPFLKVPALADEATAANALRSALEQAVRKRLMTERPCAALLSGGIDSSLIAALVQRELKAAGASPLKTFSIGFEGSEDLRYARLVADHIGSDHHEIIKTPDEFFEAIPEVIKAIESYDTTSVRASVGNWSVAKAIKDMTDCKVVFNGDGSDEVLGGYLYFYNAPTPTEFELETTRLLKDIYMYDVLRSDRSISSHGLEPRTPFLDRQFVATAKAISTTLRQPIKGKQVEKWILRKAFQDTGLLPDAVLWRKKEAFSDGVSGKTKAWYEEIADRVPSSPITITEHLPPKTLEQAYYRSIFEELYPNCEKVIPYFWMPNWSTATDPSARTLSVYAEKSDAPDALKEE